MKITVEFDSLQEYQRYMQPDEPLSIPRIKGAPIDDFTRRKNWSELELGFIRDNYQTKKIPWIAKQLRRRPSQVYQRLARMYAEGLPVKQPRNGTVE